jgi:TRAP-type transport system periplasmic protein
VGVKLNSKGGNKMKECKSTQVYFVGIMLLFAILLAPCAQSSVRAAEFELKFGAMCPETLYMAKIFKSWMAKVEKDTNGRIHFTPYWQGTLITPTDAPDEVARGVVDVANFSADYPKVGFDIVKNSGTFFYGISMADHKKLHLQLRKKFPEMDAEFVKYGKLIADDNVMAPMQLLTKKPIRTLSDIKGLKIKATPSYIPLLKELGAEPVMLSMFDVYLAVQKGTVDGLLAPLDVLVPLKIIEVVKYITNLNLTYSSQPGLMIRWDMWNKLPPDIKKVLEDNSRFFSDENLRISMEENRVNEAAAKKAGIQFVELSKQDLQKMDEILYRISQEKAAELDARKLPGTAMLKEIRGFRGK